MLMKEKLLIISVLLMFITVEGDKIYQKRLLSRQLDMLTSVEVQDIVAFRIYRGTSRPPSGSFVELKSSELIVKEFLHSLTDLKRHRKHRDSIDDLDNIWFMEIVVRGKMFQIDCYVPSHFPSRQNDTVVGELGKFFNTRVDSDGYFQSRKLYQWYQKYSHRWLEPEGSQLTPVPQPDPPGGG